MDKAIGIGFAVLTSTTATVLVVWIFLSFLVLGIPVAFIYAGRLSVIFGMFVLAVEMVMPTTFFLLPIVAAWMPKRYGFRMIALLLTGGLGGALTRGLSGELSTFDLWTGGIVGEIAAMAFVAALAWWERQVREL